MKKIKNYIRNTLLFLLEKLGMEVDLYINQNGNWTFLREERFPNLPQIGEEIEILVEDQNKIYKVINVRQKKEGSNPIIHIS